MGYETKIYAGYLSDSTEADGTRYMRVVGMVDLSKCGLSPAKEGVPVYFYYEGDGNTPTIEDSYGDKLRAIPVAQMLEKVKNSSKSSPDYRRWKPAIALLESLKQFEGDEIYCAIYGY